MSQMIDLMPEASRVRMTQRRRTRQWLVLYATTIAGMALSWVALGVAEGRMRSGVFAQQANLQMVSHQRTRAAQIRQRVAQLLAEQWRHDSLVWPVQLGGVIDSVGGLVPESVSLTSVSITPRQLRRLGAPSADGSRRNDSRLAVELRGVALTDLDLAAFLAGLEDHPLFSGVAVDYAREADVSGTPAREFGVTCEIELSVRYRFEDGTPAAMSTESAEPARADAGEDAP
ncbi:MAG: PilN domain-containing protein [Phycisphaerales bacterium]